MSSQIEILSNEFNMLLTEYQDTYKNYMNAINSDNKNLKTIPDFSFAGKNINTLNNSSLSNCQELCSVEANCSGATFNNNSQSCTLSSSPGSIVNTPQSVAIVQESIFYSYKLQGLNTKLTDINKQIMDINNNNYDNIKNLETSKQYQTLNNNYEILANERNEIERMIRVHETLNTAYTDGDINVTSNYFVYVSLLIITILLIFLLINFSLPNQQRGGGKFSFNNNCLITILGLFVIFLIYKIVL